MRGGKCRAFAHGFGNLQHRGFQGGVVFFFTEAFQCLGNWNGRAEQSTHFAGEGGDLLSLNASTESNCSGRSLSRFRQRRAGVPSARGLRGWREIDLARPELESATFRSSASMTAADGAAASFDCLITKRVHSSKSPEETRRISSRTGNASGSFLKRVLMHRDIVLWAMTLSSALERLCEISFPQLGTDGQQFENSDSSAIAGSAAFLASCAAYKICR